ncbi:hypothetical protein [Hymenobacter sp. B81]|uniref:hypothetical protein n=1 Tax=Hymenobacter sp. B81 TaxID=3344878 RepID=UPI0037DD15AA
MEVSCQLRKDQVSKKGTALIQLTFCWEGRRLRISSGEKCRPKDWNDARQRVKANPGSYAAEINAVLDDWTKAADQVHREARRQQLRLDEQAMEAAIRNRYRQLVAEAAGEPAEVVLPVVAPAAPTLLQEMERWITYQEGKVSLRSGQRLSASYLTGLRRSLRELQAFEAECTWPLKFAGMDHAFYMAFQDFALSNRGRDINTFGAYIKNLKTFLIWATKQNITVNPNFRDFAVVDIYRGADALTQDELLRLAAIDFADASVRAYLEQHFEPGAGPRHGGRAAFTLDDYIQRTEEARDKILQCCYFALRISDADRLAPKHLEQDIVRIFAGKSDGICIIPFFDDDVFKPRALVAKYAGRGLATCLPRIFKRERYLPHIQHLAGITRIKLTSKVGRKTFATLKIYQGIPKSQVMLATGHKTESSFNRYLGVNEEELLGHFRKTARKVE